MLATIITDGVEGQIKKKYLRIIYVSEEAKRQTKMEK